MRAVGIIPPTPYKVMARCGLAWDKARLGAPGWEGEKSGLSEQPAKNSERVCWHSGAKGFEVLK